MSIDHGIKVRKSDILAAIRSNLEGEMSDLVSEGVFSDVGMLHRSIDYVGAIMTCGGCHRDTLIYGYKLYFDTKKEKLMIQCISCGDENIAEGLNLPEDIRSHAKDRTNVFRPIFDYSLLKKMSDKTLLDLLGRVTAEWNSRVSVNN